MTKIAILPVPTGAGVSYRAVTSDRESVGKTAGEALDALTTQLGTQETNTLVIVQNLRPDQFFTAEQQQRLAELMAHWRTARDQGYRLPPAEQAELDALIEAELKASEARTALLLDELAR